MKKLLLVLLIPFLLAAAPSRTKTYTSGEVINPSDVTENEDNMFRYLQTGVDTYADSTIVSADITDGTIVNADISSSAAITYGRLSFSNNIVAGDIATDAIDTAEIKDGSIVNADISASAAITDSKLAQITTASKVSSTAITGGVVLPAGALFFMVTGSCPSGTTDVTATYSNKFVRINATGGSTGGADTDSITLTTTELPAHTHTASLAGVGSGGTTRFGGVTDAEQASVATNSTGSGAAFTVDTVPAYVTAKACQVN